MVLGSELVQRDGEVGDHRGAAGLAEVGELTVEQPDPVQTTAVDGKGGLRRRRAVAQVG